MSTKMEYHMKILLERKQVQVETGMIAHISVSCQPNTEIMRYELAHFLYMFPP